MGCGMEKKFDIKERTFEYSLRAVRLYQALQKGKDGAGWIIGKQYLRAATSIGANVEEGHGSESMADFVHKLSIAQKEARESLYWLKLLSGAEIFSTEKLQLIIEETNEILLVLSSIIVNTKKNNNMR